MIKKKHIIVSLTFLLMALSACSDHGAEFKKADPGDDDNKEVSFSATVHPLLLNSCGGGSCHSGVGQHEVSVDSYEKIMRRSTHGLHVMGGFADSSAMYIAVTSKYSQVGLTTRMPRLRDTLTTLDQNTLRDWINQGAKEN